jgi:hypothetical protein
MINCAVLSGAVNSVLIPYYGWALTRAVKLKKLNIQPFLSLTLISIVLWQTKNAFIYPAPSDIIDQTQHYGSQITPSNLEDERHHRVRIVIGNMNSYL